MVSEPPRSCWQHLRARHWVQRVGQAFRGAGLCLALCLLRALLVRGWALRQGLYKALELAYLHLL